MVSEDGSGVRVYNFVVALISVSVAISFIRFSINVWF